MLRPARGIGGPFTEVIASMDVIESHGAHIPILGFATMTLKEDLCVELVAEALRLRKPDVAIVSGERGRFKLLELSGDPAALLARLADWAGVADAPALRRRGHLRVQPGQDLE